MMEMPQAKCSKQEKTSSPRSKNTQQPTKPSFEAGEENTATTSKPEGEGEPKDSAEAKMSDNTKALGSKAVKESGEGEEKMCRYCFCGDDEGELISPCECKGGQRYVHLHCLRRWQRMVLVSQPTHPRCYEDDVRYRKCNVCTANFTCAPPKRVELMESFTGAEIAALVREGCIIASSPAFSQDIYSRFRTLLPVEREQLSLDHWYQGVFLITAVEPEPDQVRIPIGSQARLEALRTQFDDDNVLQLSHEKSFRLLPEGPLSGITDTQALRTRFLQLSAPTELYLESTTPTNYGEDRIEAVNLVKRKTYLTNSIKKAVEEAKSGVKRSHGLKELPPVELTHYAGGPCDEDTLSCSVVFRGNGRGWEVCESMEVAIAHAIARQRHEEIRSGTSVELTGLKSKAELNGELALALRFDKSSGRWCVRCFDGSGIKVKPENLKPVPNENGEVMCFWGNARWTRAQLLGEVARGSWGLCCASIVDLLKPIKGKWNGIQDRLAFSPITEMSEDYMRRATTEMTQISQVAPVVDQGSE